MRSTVARPTTRIDPALGSLALIYVIGGLLCVLGALAPANPNSPVRVHATFAAISLVCGAVLARVALRRVGPIWQRAVLHSALVVATLLTASFMMLVPTGTGESIIGYNGVYLAMVAAYFLPRREAQAHAALIGCCLVVAAQLSPVTDNRYLGMVLAVSVVTVSEVLGRLVGRLKATATVDDLTGALNRQALREVTRHVLADANRRGHPVSLAVIDLDNFKAVNDRGGHVAGDALLATVAEAWRTTLRRSDSLARIGGDEFVVLLPGTDQDQAQAVVRRMRDAHDVSWSVGVATAGPGAELSDLFDEADQALYRNKSTRRSVART